MKTLLAGLFALTTTAFAQLPNPPNPPAPSLKEVLKRPNPQVVIFQPTTLARGQSLNVSHVLMGDGSVKPGAGAQLIIYSSTPGLNGEHEVLYRHFHPFSREGSPVAKFPAYLYPTDQVTGPERQGIIAVLIGLLLPAVNQPPRPAALPPQDLVAAEITDGTSIGLLLPAVQKVRSAAAR